MGTEWKERWHEIRERVIHPFGGHGHREEERKAGGEPEAEERRKEEHKVDDAAGSEYRGD